MSATALSIAYTGTVNHVTRGDLYDKTVDIYTQRANSVPVQGAQYFSKSSSKTLDFKAVSWSNILGLPRVSGDTEPLPFAEPAPGHTKEITIPTYRLATKITETMVDIDQSGKVMMMIQGLPDSMKSYLEYMFANVFNTGTTTEGADGSYVFANDHIHAKASAGTFSNVETNAALAPTTVGVMRTNMRRRKNEQGLVSGIMLEKLIVPPDLEDLANRITTSPKLANSANNDINPYQGLSFSVWDYLTNTTAWYGWGNLPESMWGLHYVVLKEPVIRRLAYPDPNYPGIVAGFYAKSQVAAGASVVYNVHRNAGGA